MKKTVKDGFHRVYGYLVSTENGCVIRGVEETGKPGTPSYRETTVYPYRENPSGGYTDCAGITLAAFRAGVQRGTVIMR